MRDIAITTKTLNNNSYELPRLNERYLYITLFSTVIALGYSILHIVFDYDYLRFSSVGDISGSKSSPFYKAKAKILDVLLRSTVFAVTATIGFPIVYWIFRGIIWRNGLLVARYVLLYKLHRSGEYVSFPLSFEMLFITLFSSFFLFLLWEACNTGFNIYMSLGPLHRGVLISFKSRDPNGTLITGLKSSGRPLTRLLAFQELAYISLNDRVRRASIYSDIDRPIDQFGPPPANVSSRLPNNKNTTSAWAEIYGECILIAEDLTKKLTSAGTKNNTNSNKPSGDGSSTTAKNTLVKETHQQAVTTATSPPPIKVIRDNIFLDPSLNTNHKRTNSDALRARIVDNLQDKEAHRSKEVISAITEARSTVQTYISQYKSLITKFLEAKPGAPFRYTVRRQTNALIPNVALCNDALLALSYLVCFSIDEDALGTVQRYIPDILSSYYRLILALESYISDPPVHWSNPASTITPELINSSTRRAREVLEAADSAFELIAVRFRPYLSGMGLSDPVQRRAVRVATESDIAF
ncbi:Ndc1p [Sugiyamaella lignohabitans]|uniref:Ndc1p n=1 Tax=Sugiyamaella lignohabitans TaxID=796027 RepID=A0A167EQS5_9ASCO|nr:Ndc1p [Sugiyamaella lignohabitans]ANB14359.1 Ndc1p [Sugiyamaella lignohabitans]